MNDRSATVASLLSNAAVRIGGDSPQLDAALLLEAVLDRTPTWFRTWPEHPVGPADVARFDALVDRRVAGHPVVHLLGHQGFWSLTLQVNEHTLIPRPDTECLVEAALALTLPVDAAVIDLGTGTGAIALALATERPGWQVSATDVVPDAVALATDNARELALPVTVYQSRWFEDLAPARFHLIVSNPPYIEADDRHLEVGDVRFEPASALVAGDDGLDDIRTIVRQAPDWLHTGGWLMLEHGYNQGEAVRALLSERGFADVGTGRDYGGNDRFSLGRWP
ncbi:peptide chain release factor N(5)-glutamine methyltransferase [Marinobacter sp. JSM 1782161]|uniref:peptide chain release factor N(5)-glutamine methyltransferase n=1 Tax=Marinobacter sp. JSM 1782161 TaxID=2685906 RepID=UPI001402F4B6|nr:peptide chain release factor N(5)-glutamine methyltransferase [Marinobacter sp. JSM 1782161]